MPTPIIVGRTTTPILSQPYVRLTYPSGIQEGDFAIAQIGLSALSNLTVNWVNGWVCLGFSSVSTTAQALICKWLNGDETTEDESRDNGTTITAMTVLRNCGINRGVRSAVFGTTAANPNPPSLTVPWTLDDSTFFQTSLIGSGSGAVTGGDPDYNAGVNDSSSSGFRIVTGERVINASSQDPAAWTRASAAYVARTNAIASVETIDAPRIRRINSFYAADAAVHDYSIVIPSGANRSIFFWFSSNATSAVLDPDGLNLPLQYVSDGTTIAQTPGSTDNLYGCWMTIDPDDMPSAGTYTLRYNPESVSNAQIFYVCLDHASQFLQAEQVVKFWHVSAAQDQDFDLDVPGPGGTLLWVARRGYAGAFGSAGAYIYTADPPNTCTADGEAVTALREIHANSSFHAALFARQYDASRGNDTIAHRLRLASANTGGYVGISIAYQAPPSAVIPPPGRVPLPGILTQSQLDRIIASKGGAPWLAYVKGKYGLKMSAPDGQGLVTVTYARTS